MYKRQHYYIGISQGLHKFIHSLGVSKNIYLLLYSNLMVYFAFKRIALVNSAFNALKILNVLFLLSQKYLSRYCFKYLESGSQICYVLIYHNFNQIIDVYKRQYYYFITEITNLISYSLNYQKFFTVLLLSLIHI